MTKVINYIKLNRNWAFYKCILQSTLLHSFSVQLIVLNNKIVCVIYIWQCDDSAWIEEKWKLNRIESILGGMTFFVFVSNLFIARFHGGRSSTQILPFWVAWWKREPPRRVHICIRYSKSQRLLRANGIRITLFNRQGKCVIYSIALTGRWKKKQRNVLENSKALPCGRMQPDIVTACLLVKQVRRFAIGHQRLMI